MTLGSYYGLDAMDKLEYRPARKSVLASDQLHISRTHLSIRGDLVKRCQVVDEAKWGLLGLRLDKNEMREYP